MINSNELKSSNETDLSNEHKQNTMKTSETEFKPLPQRDQENKENEGEKKLE